MKDVLDIFKLNKNIQKVLNCLDNDAHISLSNTSKNINCLLIKALFQKYEDKQIIFVASNSYHAIKYYELFSRLCDYTNVNLYLFNEVVASEIDATNKEFAFERSETISNIINKKAKIIVTDINSISKKLIPHDVILKNIINIKAGIDIKREDLVKQFIKIGYVKAPTTSSVGSFSVRGEIIDIFPINYKTPLRISFFDSEVETIKEYDIDSQMSIKGTNTDEINIFPINEIIYDDPESIINKFPHINNYRINQDIFNIENYIYSERLSKYLNYMYDSLESLCDYTDNKIIFHDDVSSLKEAYLKTQNDLFMFQEDKEEAKIFNYSYYFDFEKTFDCNKTICICNDLKQRSNMPYKNITYVNLDAYEVSSYHNNVKLLLEDAKISKNKFYLAFSSANGLSLMKEILDTKGIEYNKNDSKIELIEVDSAVSFAFNNDITLISENDINTKIHRKNVVFRSTNNKTILINSRDDLKPGDYVVHYDYGIGKYLGIKSIKTGDYVNDYISIKYANIDLHIPVENISMLEKYQSEEDYTPRLSTIGTDEWKNKKEKIKNKLENLSRQLILLHAYRDSLQGYKYEKDNEIQIAFENDFEYSETKDQISAIEDIKKDMEEGKIIDRLICGDVGFGKTEVAIRIAMKTVLNGKQVAYLAPTTILTRQHFYTFKERMEKYGVNVSLMNRLVGPRQKKKVIEGLKNGSVDIVIGTHSLLNDAIEYKDLGLLIVDEEQRFGVTHKEKIKQLKNNINVLTLTATPIPRTLQLSLTGARQISMIETSPMNRYPVQTYVLEKDYSVVREAIYNEIARDGQVFYLHNRIDDIFSMYDKLKKLVPEARITIAHGKMTKEALEDAVQAYIDKKFDVLLCTTIIETGIDIPNSNTLIVDMSDRLGLAQMYQIRGRVGRSDRVSYAYFMYDRDSILTESGEKRLNALKEFTSLGSGYKIALCDLAIRGAGNLLGSEQSGYIDALGIDLYMKLLSETINEVKGKVEEQEFKPEIMVDVSKHIDDSYVSDDDIKIFIHKEINTIDSKEKKEEVILELNDRFGKINETISLYIEKIYMDCLCRRLNVEKIEENQFRGKIIFTKEKSNTLDPKVVFKCAYELGEDFSVEYKNKRFMISIIKLLDNKKWIYKATSFLEKFI